MIQGPHAVICRCSRRTDLRLGWVIVFFAIFAIFALSGIGLATPQPDDPASQPHDTAAIPSTAEARIARLRTMSPDEEPDPYLTLGRLVLKDLEASANASFEAEVRCGIGRALRVNERFREACDELLAAAALARETGDLNVLSECLLDLARASFYLGEFEHARTFCNQGLEVPEIRNDPNRSWKFLNIVAAIQLQQGEWEAAIETCSEALEGRERADDIPAVGTLLNNIGVAHMYLGDHEPALEYLQRAREIKTELGAMDQVADILSNIGDIKHFQGHTEEAIEIQLEALRLRELADSELRIAMSHRSLAAALHAAGRDPEALDQVDKALEIERRLDLKPEIAACLAIRAEALAGTGRIEEAIAAATQSLELARELGMKGREVVALDALVESEIAAGNVRTAIEHQSNARKLESELITGEIRREFAGFQSAFEAREKEREIELLRKDNELQTLELRHQRLWRNSLLAGIVLLIVIATAGWHRFLGKRREIRDRRKADAALLQSMERYRLLFERNLSGVFQTDLDGTILITNQTFASMLGYRDTDELSGKSISNLTTDPEECQRCLDQLAAQREIRNYELTMTTRDGKPVEILINAGRVVDASGEGELVEGIAIDITDRNRADEDRRRLEIQMQQSQKLESLGVLAGGIAHDFNNMLMAILSNISLAKRLALTSGEMSGRLTEAEEACLRATGLTQQLLTFSKGGRPIRKTTSMSKVAVEAAQFAVRGSNCRLEHRIDPDIWLTEIDEGQIVQAIQNLVLNAVQSMPGGGVVAVSTENVHLGDGDLPTLKAGRYVRVEVSDTGDGIPDHHLDRIFDPFFTTKQTGSGLGLATTFSIIRSHGGAIVARSELGRGSRFSVFIPASDNAHTAPETNATESIRGRGRILIMDDDEAVRSAAAELLETIGYEAETAADGAEAIDLYSHALDTDHPFNAVVLDLTVPRGIGGRETIARLLEIDPEVKAIVSSGYSTDPVMANFREHGFSGVAAKPYRLAELARTLRLVLKIE